LPEAAKWWMEKVEPIGRRLTRLTGPLVHRVVGLPMPSDAVFDAGEELFAKLEHMRQLLANPEKTSVRVVLTLEQVVIKEAQRAFTYFHLYDYPTDLGEWRRNLVLPRALIDAAALGAQFEDHTLKIRFAAPERTAAQRRR